MKPTRNGIVGCFSTFFLLKLETLVHSQQKCSKVCFLLYYFSNGYHTRWSGECCRSCVVLLLYWLTSDFFIKMKINERTQTRLQDCRWMAKMSDGGDNGCKLRGWRVQNFLFFTTSIPYIVPTGIYYYLRDEKISVCCDQLVPIDTFLTTAVFEDTLLAGSSVVQCVVFPLKYTEKNSTQFTTLSGKKCDSIPLLLTYSSTGAKRVFPSNAMVLKMKHAYARALVLSCTCSCTFSRE